MIAKIAVKIATLLCVAVTAGPASAEPASRFIPLQLIVGDRWNGERTITYPSGRFDSTCWYGDRAQANVTAITIQEIDYACYGQEHCLRVEWTLRDWDNDRINLDHRIYDFAPNLGMVHEVKAP